MMLRDVHCWRRRLLAFFLRRRAPISTRKPVNRYHNPSGLDTAVPILVRVTLAETGRIPICTDHGTLPNLRFSFADAHMRLDSGGWIRQVTVREFGVSKDIAGVNMRLNAGGIRELHRHKAAEWAYMLYGCCRYAGIA